MGSFRDRLSAKTSIEQARQTIEDMNSKGGESYKDERFWKPSPDKAGNATAVIRFLPPTDNYQHFFAMYYRHAFKAPNGKWFIENCPTSLGQGHKCPVCEANGVLWENSSSDSDPNRKLARDRKRKKTFVSNIMVIKDKSQPENEGKVFLYSYGQQIFDVVNTALFPNEGLDPDLVEQGIVTAKDPIRFYDFWEGANFVVQQRKSDGFPNFKSSQFLEPTPLLDGDDEKLEELWKSQYDLSEFTSPAFYKSYDELKSRLESVYGTSETRGQSRAQAPSTTSENVSKRAPAITEKNASDSAEAWDSDDDSDSMLSALSDLIDD